MKRSFSFLLATSLLTISCVKQEMPVFEENADAVKFNASIMPSTRATDYSFEEGDEISVFATDDGYLYTDNYAQNIRYGYTDGRFTTSESLVYPDKNTTLSFYAVYPYGQYTTPDFRFNVNTDQSTHEGYTGSDLMTASNAGRDQDVVDLVFNHDLTKIVINLSSENLPAGTQSITFKNVYYSVNADLASNTYKATGTRTDIKASSNGTNSFKAILPPQTIEEGETFVEIIIGGVEYIWEVERQLVHSSGVEYVYDLHFNEGSVAFTADINPWNTPSDIESIIPQEYLDLMSPYIPVYDGTTPPNIEGIWLVSPNELYYESMGGTRDDYNFAPDYVWFYNQSSDNTLDMRSTQNLGDLSEAEGVFVSGTGNDFTVYFKETTSYDDGTWLIKATVISGTKYSYYIEDYRKAFIILDKYDPYDEFMDVGDFRVLEDADYFSEEADWPLDTKSPSPVGYEVEYIRK